MVMVSAADSALVFPAVSDAKDVRACVPSVSAAVTIDQSPDPSAVAVPTAPSISELSVTVASASAVPLSVGVVSLVMLSVSELPESLAVSRSGAEGAVGAVVSTVIVSATEAALVLPAVSVAVAVRS